MSASLILEIVIDPTQPVTPDVTTVEVNQNPFVIGRGKGSHWVLDNGRNTVSRSHARVETVLGRFYLVGTGRNPISVNSREIPNELPREIRVGDSFTIEEFEIRVREGSGQQDVRPGELKGRMPTPSPQPGPLHKRNGEETSREGREQSDEKDWWKEPSLGTQSSVDSGSERDPFGDIFDSPAPQPRLVVVDASDPSEGVTASEYPVTQREAAPSFEPEPVRRDDVGRDAAAMSALLSAAGIDETTAAKMLPDDLGRALRVAIDGYIKLHRARTSLGKHLRVARAFDDESAVNPLKTSRNSADALIALFDSSAEDRVDGARAIREIVSEFESHEMAMVAAIGKAFDDTIESFNPAKIEQEVARRAANPLAALTVKSKCWDQFVETFSRFGTDRDAMMRRLFLDPFTEEYIKSIAQQRSSRRLPNKDRSASKE